MGIRPKLTPLSQSRPGYNDVTCTLILDTADTSRVTANLFIRLAMFSGSLWE